VEDCSRDNLYQEVLIHEVLARKWDVRLKSNSVCDQRCWNTSFAHLARHLAEIVLGSKRARIQSEKSDGSCLAKTCDESELGLKNDASIK
jgi:hypothetical protein